MIRRVPILMLVASLALAFAPTAFAEDGEAGGDLRAKIQKKMQRILELMRKNEEALLRLSTGKAAVTEKVDVEVPPPSGGQGSDASSGGTSSGSESSGSESSGDKSSGSRGGGEGAEVERKLGELIQGQKQSGGAIPGEIEELVELIPL